MRWPDRVVQPLSRIQPRLLLVLPVAPQADLPSLLRQAIQAAATEAAPPAPSTDPLPMPEWHLVTEPDRRADLLRQWPRALAQALGSLQALHAGSEAVARGTPHLGRPLDRLVVHADAPPDAQRETPGGSPISPGGTGAIARPAAHPLLQRLWAWASDPACRICLLLADPACTQGQLLALGLSMIGRAQDRVIHWPAAACAPAAHHASAPPADAMRLVVDTRDATVQLAGLHCQLQPAELFVYTLLALRRHHQAGADAGFAGKPGAVLIDGRRWVGFDGPWLQRTQALLPACRFQPLPAEQWRSRVSCINRKLRRAFGPDLAGPALVIGPAETGRRDGRYGLLHAQPESIHIR